MNIVINAVFMHKKPRGVGRVANNILEKIAEVDKKNQYYICYGKWQEYDFLKIKNTNFHFVKLDIPINAFIRNFYLAFILPFEILKYKPNVYHLMDTSPLYIKTCPTISTIHDLAEFTVPDKYNSVKCFLRKIYVKRQAKKSDLVLTVSNYTKNDLIKRFNLKKDKVRVVYNFFENSNMVVNDKSTRYKKYFLMVGELERTKNVGMVVEAFSNIKKEIDKEYKLIIVGKHGNDYNNVLKIISRCNAKESIELLDYVSDSELFNLYNNAFALIFASLFEGFGLPLLEAMSFGIPVIASNASSMPEVVGNAGILFDPCSCEQLEQCMLELTRNPQKREKMIREGYVQIEKFEPNNIVKQLLNIYGEYR